jgi:hypothetical protein
MYVVTPDESFMRMVDPAWVSKHAKENTSPGAFSLDLSGFRVV